MITVKQLSLLGMGRDSNQTMSSHPSIINIESLHLTFFMSMMMMMTAGEITGITMALMLTHGAWASCSFLSALQSVVFFTNSMLVVSLLMLWYLDLCLTDSAHSLSRDWEGEWPCIYNKWNTWIHWFHDKIMSSVQLQCTWNTASHQLSKTTFLVKVGGDRLLWVESKKMKSLRKVIPW